MDTIFDYVSLDDPGAALKLLDAIDATVSKLADSPRIGTAVSADDLGPVQTGYRYLVVAPYLIFYRIEGDEVRIGRVLHSKQDWLHMLFGNR